MTQSERTQNCRQVPHRSIRTVNNHQRSLNSLYPTNLPTCYIPASFDSFIFFLFHFSGVLRLRFGFATGTASSTSAILSHWIFISLSLSWLVTFTVGYFFFYNEGLENIFLTTKAPSRIVTLALQDLGTFILVNNAPLDLGLIHVHAGMHNLGWPEMWLRNIFY